MATGHIEQKLLQFQEHFRIIKHMAKMWKYKNIIINIMGNAKMDIKMAMEYKYVSLWMIIINTKDNL
jgi:hypothetical protein